MKYFLTVLLALSCVSGWSQSKSLTEAWVNNQTGYFGDQGDGTYHDPSLAIDYSALDVTRVRKHNYLVGSTFEAWPRITILHSRDLVNWETIGAAFPDMGELGPNFNWDQMNNYKNGLYAPSVRHHEESFMCS